MNPYLAHLLSRAFDGALAPEHREDLEKSGLTDSTIRAQHLRSVPPAMIPRLLGFDVPGVRSALLFPYRSPDGGFMPHVRLKVFPSLVDRAGHSVKYLQPKGAPPRLYLCASVMRDALTGLDPLWVVEGEKKALAVAQTGRPAIGIAGVEGWHRRGERHRLLPDFDGVWLEGRVVEILPDGDYETNAAVREAIFHLGLALAARGALPGVRHLPRELPR